MLAQEAPDAEFRDLLARLLRQREADISAAVAALRDENASLSEEIAELRGGRRRGAAGAGGGDVLWPTAATGEASLAAAVQVVPGGPGGLRYPDEEPVALGSPTGRRRNSACRRAGALGGALHTIPEALSLRRGDEEPRLSMRSVAQESAERSEDPRFSVRSSVGGSSSKGSSVALSSVAASLMTARTNFSPVAARISATEVSRFSHMFKVDTWNTDAATISAGDLLPVLEKRGLRNLSLQRVSSVMQRLSGVSPPLEEEEGRSPWSDHDDANYKMPFKIFVDTMLSTNIAKGLSNDIAEDARRWQQALMTQPIDEVVDRLAKTGCPEAQGSSMWASRSSVFCASNTWSLFSRRGRLRILQLLNTVVAFTVMLSVISLSLSMDYCLDCEVWFYVELVAAIIFVAELLIKLYIFGIQEFLFGDDRLWNWNDMLITVLDSLEVGTSTLYRIQGQDGNQMFSVGTVLVALRTLRILRFARLVKMLRSPLLHELANILQGFMLGLPALLWVVMVIWIVLWVIGAAFRHLIGPEAGGELLTDKCGFDGDSMDTGAIAHAATIQMFPECGDRHRLYGDEYCSTVIGCSFTVFRCMIGDCNSKGGHSLPAHLSAGYKLRFDLMYVFGMIVLIFGLFNVITAVFVESTMRGLAAQDTRIKRQEKYHVKHVKKALEKLVQRIVLISETYRKTRDLEATDSATSPVQGLVRRVFGSAWLLPQKAFSEAASPASSEINLAIDPSQLTLSEGAFNEVLRDEDVQCVLDELDINLGTDNASIFRIFKKDRDGQLPLAEMLATLMMLRGDTSKADFIGPSVMIGGLREEVRGDVLKVQEMLLSTRQALVDCQRQIRALAEER